MVVPSFQARLVAAEMLSPHVRSLVFERTDGAPLQFDAGQWMNLVLPQRDGVLRRAYSIASAADGSPRFELAVTRIPEGLASTQLHGLAIGAEVTIEGPQGFFTRPLSASGPSLFVATGTGITPLRAMLLAALAAGDTRPLWLLFGCRLEEDLIYRRELEPLAAAHENVRVELTLSRPGPAWRGRCGYVQLHVPELWRALVALGAGTPHAYVCGLQKMVGGVRELLRGELGATRGQVHSERYD